MRRSRLKELSDFLFTVLKWPLLVALFGFNAFAVIPFAVLSIAKFGAIGFILLIAAESPIFILAIREAWRKWNLKPAVDRWETSQEIWNEALNDYVKMLDSKSENNQSTGN